MVTILYSLTGAIILKLSYGYTIEPDGPDPLVEFVDRMLVLFSVSATPGKWLVDNMPFRTSSVLDSMALKRCQIGLFHLRAGIPDSDQPEIRTDCTQLKNQRL